MNGSTRRRTDPRSALAALLSFIFPGFGQAYNRQFALAVVFAIPVILVLALGAAFLVTGRDGGFGRLLDSRLLVALLVLDAALLAWRLAAILQAHTERSWLRLRVWSTWLTASLVVLTVAMHALPAFYVAKAMDTIGTVSLEGGGALFQNRGGRDVVIAAPSHQPDVSRGERVTILFVGIDYGPGRDHHLTDTMLVATLDPATGQGAMVSVPRDIYGAPLPDGRPYNAKLNSLMATASSDPDTYPLGGPGTLKATIGELLGTRIHYFAAIDLAGMRQVIDTIGGITLDVQRTVDDPTYVDPFNGSKGLYIEPGVREMDGLTALAFVRSRMGAGEDDFTRAERQQQVLTAIVERLTAANLLVTLPGLLDAVRDNLATDIPSARLPALADEAQSADLDAIERFILMPPDYVTPEPSSEAGYILHPNFEAIRELGDRIFGPAPPP